MSSTSRHRRELANEIAKLRGLERSADPALDDAKRKALALQIREQAEICLDLLDKYQSSVPGRMWSDAERRCQPLREDLRRTGIRFRVASGEMAIRGDERLWRRSWWRPADPVPTSHEILGRFAGAETGQVASDPQRPTQVPAIGVMRPVEVELIDLALDPDPQSLPAEPTQMMTLVTILLGPPPDGGGEIFRATLCTPEWLSTQCEAESLVSGAGILVVRSEDFDECRIRREVERFLSRIHEPTWHEVVRRVKEWFPEWEFDGYAL